MSRYQLILANTDLPDVLKVALYAYKYTYLDADPTVLDTGIEGSSMLTETDGEGLKSIENWLILQNQLSNLDTTPEGFVPALTYLYTETERNVIIGMVNIRLTMNDTLEKYYGHIGYSIHPDYRGFGYGTAQFELALEQAKNLGLSQILLMCNETNQPSRKLIEKFGGEFLGTVEHPDKGFIRRYHIDLIDFKK